MTTDKFLSLQEATDRLIDESGDCYSSYVHMAWTALGYGEFTNRMVPAPTPIEKSIARIAARHVAMTVLQCFEDDWQDLIDPYDALDRIEIALQRVAGD